MDTRGPRALRDTKLIQERRERWASDPALAGLRDYVGDLSIRGRCAPDFDPSDAATETRVLLVLEAPGPMSAASKGSGFISPDNNDQTAANVWAARQQAGLVEGVLHWNICPWYLGEASVKPSPLELADGAVQLRYLLDLLPALQVVVLCGDYARRGWRGYTSGLIDGPGPVAIETYHPSAQGLLRGNRRMQFNAAIRRTAELLKT